MNEHEHLNELRRTVALPEPINLTELRAQNERFRPLLVPLHPDVLDALIDIAEAAHTVINNDAAIQDSRFHGSPSYHATYGKLREALARTTTQ